ncbi:hypothetical protein D3C76_1446100 [compost metagenome]
MDIEVGHVAVHRRTHFGALEVQFCRFELRLGLLIIGQGRVGEVAGVVAVFPGDHQVVHVGPAMGVDLAHLPRRLA